MRNWGAQLYRNFTSDRIAKLYGKHLLIVFFLKEKNHLLLAGVADNNMVVVSTRFAV